jgi:hypothetical protein
LNELIDNPVISFQHLGGLKNSQGNVKAERILINEVLILVITLSTQDNYETDSPENNWEEQLEVAETAKDLKNVLGMASILHTTGEDYNAILMNARMKLSIAQKQMIHYCNSDFGQLYRFGKNHNYLLVHDSSPDQLEKFNKFLFEEFPNLLNLNFMIEKSYQSILESQQHLFDIEHQMEQNMIELSVLGSEKDPIMLAIRKDHVSDLEKKAKSIISRIKNYASQLKKNMTEYISKASMDQSMIDSIYNDENTSFHDYNKFAQEQIKKNQQIQNR